jgi:uncharacterized delta-60 repeat protein
MLKLKKNGKPDKQFGTNGRVVKDFGGNEYLTSVVLQPDGKIVVGGLTQPGADVATLARYNPNGTLDTSFGNGGVVTLFGGVYSLVNALALQPNGQIVGVGYIVGSGASDVAATRVNTDGSVDTSFGANGVASIGVSTWQNPNDRGNATVLQPDGKIVIFGDYDAGYHDRVFLLRYTANGTLDPTFGSGGLTTDEFGFHNGGRAMAIQPDGKLVVTGGTVTGSADTYVARYNTDGSADTSFGTNGRVFTSYSAADDSSNSVALQPNGKIVIGGYQQDSAGQYNSVIRRYNADGSTDSAFGNGGSIENVVGTGNSYVSSTVLQSDCKILTGGQTFNGAYHDWYVARFRNGC